MSTRKTVVYDLTPLDTQSRYRGHGRYLRDLALGLSRLGERDLNGIRLLALTHLDWDGSYRVTDDLAAFSGSPEVPAPTSGDHHRWAYKRRLVLWRALRRIGADVVHLGDATGVPLGISLARGRVSKERVRKVTTCHDLTPARWPDRYFKLDHGGKVIGAWIERRRYLTADLLVAISDATLEDAVHYGRVPRERVVRVYNGIDVERWAVVPPGGDDAVVAKYGLAGKNFVVYVGDAGWHKNIEGMMAGVAFAKRAGVDVTLVHAGLLSEERTAMVSRLAAEAGVTDRLLQLGYVSDDELPSLFRASRAHLFVSRAEGFGMTVAEAMAAGTPVITSTARALTEVAGDAALVVAPDDHAAIGDALVRVTTDRTLRADLIRRGRERVTRFSNENQAKGYAEVYRRAAAL